MQVYSWYCRFNAGVTSGFLKAWHMLFLSLQMPFQVLFSKPTPPLIFMVLAAVSRQRDFPAFSISSRSLLLFSDSAHWHRNLLLILFIFLSTSPPPPRLAPQEPGCSLPGAGIRSVLFTVCPIPSLSSSVSLGQIS